MNHFYRMPLLLVLNRNHHLLMPQQLLVLMNLAILLLTLLSKIYLLSSLERVWFLQITYPMGSMIWTALMIAMDFYWRSCLDS